MSRTIATISPSIDDLFFMIGLGADLGALETRDRGTTDVCSECGERVDLIEDKVERLSSSGTVRVWRGREAWTHRRACYDAHNARVDRRLADYERTHGHRLDLWER